ncbi:uncharacterized protein LOC142639591 [Castanea sativa]|uniref:uncharacterized protein LOC142639591 n=1 Tax=Castanea sativa TaxID=21020 RepID=UPI003F649784
MALLAKQGWHLQMGSESLVYRIPKAKYFPTSDFVHASIGHNPSYTWRSLISAQSLVIEAELIKSIPLSAILPVDKMVWAETSNGNFTVRSAYKLAVNLITSATCGTTSDGSSLRKFWKKIWSLPIPHKLWFVMMTNAAGEEKCSQLVTTALALRSNRNEILYGGEGKTGPAMSLWTTHYLQEYCSAVDSCLHATLDPVQPLLDAQRKSLLSIWSPPSAGLFKINVDGALFSSKKQAGIGVVIRDVEGRLKATLCRKIKAPLGSLEVEAKAYKAGLLLAKHLGLRGVMLEGDSLIISNALKWFTLSPTSVDAFVEGLHELGAEIGVVNFSHVRRIGNKSTYILARQAQNLVKDVIWIEEIP